MADGSSQTKDKFVAFVDILGFSQMVRAAHSGTGRLSTAELFDAVALLGDEKQRKRFEQQGFPICPAAPHIRGDVDFVLLQTSDCVVVSTEVSPAGVINLLGYCWRICVNLLVKNGLMCRGYITRGQIYHTSTQIIGVGYLDALEGEKQVSAFQQRADEEGTPFIQVDPEVIGYVEDQRDHCVKEMFERFTKSDGKVTALFPFKQMRYKFPLAKHFELDEARSSNAVTRNNLVQLIDSVERLVDRANERAVQKGAQYRRMLQEQVKLCDRLENMFRRMTKDRD